MLPALCHGDNVVGKQLRSMGIPGWPGYPTLAALIAISCFRFAAEVRPVYTGLTGILLPVLGTVSGSAALWENYELLPLHGYRAEQRVHRACI
jgi:hypothetical protein